MNTDDKRVTDILENLMAEHAAKEMQKSIDFDMVCSVLNGFGYSVVEVKYGPTKKWIDVMHWVDENHINDYQEHNGKWLFKNKNDAIMFTLKWVS